MPRYGWGAYAYAAAAARCATARCSALDPPDDGAITVRQLLNHTDGPGSYTATSPLGRTIDADPTHRFTDPASGVTVAVLMNQGSGAGHFVLAPRLLAIAAGG